MAGRLAGKVALVTGSTAGCGEATARRFAAEGARVIVTGRNAGRGEAIAAAIAGAGGEARFIRADITNEAEVEALVAATVAAYGGLDVLVNNASPTELQRGQERIDGPVTQLSTAALDRLWRGALYGYFWACRYGIAAMVAAGRGGAVVNISSMVAVGGFAGGDGYTAAKGAINATTRSMAVEYAPHGIRVNAIVLGLVLTSDAARAMVAQPGTGEVMRARHLTRFGQPADIASAALFLASDEAAFITGNELRADGGYTINHAFPAGPLGGATGGPPGRTSEG